jgi:hypothetical protein
MYADKKRARERDEREVMEMGVLGAFSGLHYTERGMRAVRDRAEWVLRGLHYTERAERGDGEGGVGVFSGR